MMTAHLAAAVLAAAMAPLAAAQVVLDMPPPPPGTATAQASRTGGDSGGEALARYAAARSYPSSVSYMPSRVGYGYGYPYAYGYGSWGWPLFGCSSVFVNDGACVRPPTSGLRYDRYVPSSTRHFSTFRGGKSL